MLASLARLLTKRTYTYALLLIALAFPAAALAATGPGAGTAPAVSGGRVAALPPLSEPALRFRHVVHDVAHRIRAEHRRERRQRFADLPGGVSIGTLEAIASCESGGDPTVVSSDGSYRGKYQFDYGTWESVGGHGDPAAASEAEQDYRAALLYSRSGASPWPVCG
jgi:Transglycosylase-like domain